MVQFVVLDTLKTKVLVTCIVGRLSDCILLAGVLTGDCTDHAMSCPVEWSRTGKDHDFVLSISIFRWIMSCPILMSKHIIHTVVKTAK